MVDVAKRDGTLNPVHNAESIYNHHKEVSIQFENDLAAIYIELYHFQKDRRVSAGRMSKAWITLVPLLISSIRPNQPKWKDKGDEVMRALEDFILHFTVLREEMVEFLYPDPEAVPPTSTPSPTD